jgi:hypothetical protein
MPSVSCIDSSSIRVVYAQTSTNLPLADLDVTPWAGDEGCADGATWADCASSTRAICSLVALISPASFWMAVCPFVVFDETHVVQSFN